MLNSDNCKLSFILSVVGVQSGISAHIRLNYIFREESGPLHGRIGIWKWWFYEHFVFFRQSCCDRQTRQGTWHRNDFFVGLANLISHSFAFTRATAHESVLTGYCSLEFVSTSHPTHTRLIATLLCLPGYAATLLVHCLGMVQQSPYTPRQRLVAGFIQSFAISVV